MTKFRFLTIILEDMEKNNNKAYFESLSFADLLKIADSYHIDVPDNLNRNFLIAELIEAEDEINEISDSAVNARAVKTAASESGDSDGSGDDFENLRRKKLPEMYNTTDVEIVFQNPLWSFVFWNISDTDIQYIQKEKLSSMFLRICSFDDCDGKNLVDSFEIKIAEKTKEQYVLLPSEVKFVAIELNLRNSSGVTRLAVSRIAERIHADAMKKFVRPGNQYELDDMMELSGARNLLRRHYINYRQLFS